MGRKFAQISVDELRDKIVAAAKKHCDVRGAESEVRAFLHSLACVAPAAPMVSKDISKVDFDFENVEYISEDAYAGCGPICGFRQLHNGLTYLGATAGGDWEFPVFFIIYWDGKDLRGYVPTKGNRFNTDTKQAFGNAENADYANVVKRWPSIKKWLDDQGSDHNEFCVSCIPDCDTDEIVEDILARFGGKITEKTAESLKPSPEVGGSVKSPVSLFDDAGCLTPTAFELLDGTDDLLWPVFKLGKSYEIAAYLHSLVERLRIEAIQNSG